MRKTFHVLGCCKYLRNVLLDNGWYICDQDKIADSILELSLDNYKVMRNDVLDDIHLSKQKLSSSTND